MLDVTSIEGFQILNFWCQSIATGNSQEFKSFNWNDTNAILRHACTLFINYCLKKFGMTPEQVIVEFMNAPKLFHFFEPSTFASKYGPKDTNAVTNIEFAHILFHGNCYISPIKILPKINIPINSDGVMQVLKAIAKY